MAILSRIKFVDDLFMRMAWVIEHVVNAETEFPRANYAKTIIWIVVEGKRTIEVNGSLHEVQAGDIVVIPPQTPRTVLPSDPASGPFHYYTIGCDIKIGSLNFAELYKLPLLTRVADISAFTEISKLTAKLLVQSLKVIKELNALDQPQLIISRVNTDETAALFALNASFHFWFARFLDMMRCYLPDEPQEIDPRISRICTYMQLNLDRRLKLPDLANYLYISESHLRLLFRKTMGVSPTEYLRQLRLQRAKELLVNTSYSLKEIAVLSGFETLNQFSRVFSTYESVPAIQYRKRYYGSVQG
ncbi:helix-turn-helix domain-containing protein [Paenibacillus allorhizosphaerae]|uniref:HTH-type transcriptional activator RhaR n=1 Tax=Paenibacillus allorhizosphaerae TaxID=2849866 RepID=A0ABM8VP89_9BACL|nr:AraC family transcriptional regulator [Paenibacillus allorhizosphaerae]CAG7652550.1 HTH-type transcriptional activator RhaR [Paenibacillus allorhizosphaerae]